MSNVLLFPGEREAVARVIELGNQYGYGNMIAHLKRAWAKKLLASQREYGVKDATYEKTLMATDVLAYPEKFEL